MPIFDNRYTGLAPTMLVIIIVWAVAAVLMLTGTLVAARQIDTKVNETITGVTSEIDTDLNNVKLAARTARIANRIETAAVPLERQLNVVIDEAKDIRATVGDAGDRNDDDILSTAQEINGNVQRIQGTVFGIGRTVDGIHGGVLSVAASVLSIRGSVVSIQDSVRNILSTARRIDATACPTPARVEHGGGRRGAVRPTPPRFPASAAGHQVVGNQPVTGICGVHGINTRGDIAINTVGGIYDDLHNVLIEVGTPPDARGHVYSGQPTRATIHGHANSIDCAIENLGKITIGPAGGTTVDLVPTAPSQYCNQ